MPPAQLGQKPYRNRDLHLIVMKIPGPGMWSALAMCKTDKATYFSGVEFRILDFGSRFQFSVSGFVFRRVPGWKRRRWLMRKRKRVRLLA
jgi:hypothetical protein